MNIVGHSVYWAHDFNLEIPEGAKGLSYGLQQFMAVAILLAVSPILILTILGISLESHGPAIFKQIRVGKNGKRFTLYKLRSMYMKDDPRYQEPESSDRDGVCKKSYNDPRITPIGRFIRKFSIDELPQLFNVIKGDMALIGPRPALPEEVNQYEHYMLARLDVTPGLTGLWQVSGRADTSFSEQIDLDLRYANERSFWLDIKIMFLTVPAVAFGRGAY